MLPIRILTVICCHEDKYNVCYIYLLEESKALITSLFVSQGLGSGKTRSGLSVLLVDSVFVLWIGSGIIGRGKTRRGSYIFYSRVLNWTAVIACRDWDGHCEYIVNGWTL